MVEAEERTAGQVLLRFRVSDTGVGIPQDRFEIDLRELRPASPLPSPSRTQKEPDSGSPSRSGSWICLGEAGDREHAGSRKHVHVHGRGGGDRADRAEETGCRYDGTRSAPSAADPARRGQPDQPDLRLDDARRSGTRGGGRGERAGSAPNSGVFRIPAVRPGADGRADAGDGRARGDETHPRTAGIRLRICRSSPSPPSR